MVFCFNLHFEPPLAMAGLDGRSVYHWHAIKQFPTKGIQRSGTFPPRHHPIRPPPSHLFPSFHSPPSSILSSFTSSPFPHTLLQYSHPLPSHPTSALFPLCLSSFCRPLLPASLPARCLSPC